MKARTRIILITIILTSVVNFLILIGINEYKEYAQLKREMFSQKLAREKQQLKYKEALLLLQKEEQLTKKLKEKREEVFQMLKEPIESAVIIEKEKKEGGYAYIHMKWVNTTGVTLKHVTFEATVFGYGGILLNSNKRSFFSHELGPIMDGFEGRLKIPVKIGGGDLNKTEIKVISFDVI